MYERRKDETGNRTIISDDIKISVLESLVPNELERHMKLNRAKFSSFTQAMDEILAYLETRKGSRSRVVDSGGNTNDMYDAALGN